MWVKDGVRELLLPMAVICCLKDVRPSLAAEERCITLRMSTRRMPALMVARLRLVTSRRREAIQSFVATLSMIVVRVP